MNNHFYKDTNALLDYKFDWSSWLGAGETITDVVVTITSGLTLFTEVDDDTSVTVWLSGGTDAQTYLVNCKITTTDGRIDEKFMIISCVDYL